MTIERRTWQADEIELRAGEDGAMPTIAGYAVVFGAWSNPLTDSRGRTFRERFAPGAFDRVLANQPDIRALWNHNADMPLGRTRNGTLRLMLDGTGLRFELTPPDTSWGRDAVESIRRRDVSGMSFAFTAQRDGGDVWERAGGDGVALRTVIDADLYEVSPVTFPAYDASSAAVRANVPDFESDSRAADEIRQAPSQPGLRARAEYELIIWRD